MFLPNFVVYLSRHFFDSLPAFFTFLVSCIFEFSFFLILATNFILYFWIFPVSSYCPIPFPKTSSQFHFPFWFTLEWEWFRHGAPPFPNQTKHAHEAAMSPFFLLWTREIIATLITFVGRGYDLLFLLFSFYMFQCVTYFFPCCFDPFHH